jgi:hypothetical protein
LYYKTKWNDLSEHGWNRLMQFLMRLKCIRTRDIKSHRNCSAMRLWTLPHQQYCGCNCGCRPHFKIMTPQLLHQNFGVKNSSENICVTNNKLIMRWGHTSSQFRSDTILWLCSLMLFLCLIWSKSEMTGRNTNTAGIRCFKLVTWTK